MKKKRLLERYKTFKKTKLYQLLNDNSFWLPFSRIVISTEIDWFNKWRNWRAVPTRKKLHDFINFYYKIIIKDDRDIEVIVCDLMTKID